METIAQKILANRCVASEEDVKIMRARLSFYGFADQKEYKASSMWKDLREKMKKELPYYCQICGSDYRLSLHHKTYISICREIPDDLSWLCQKCHFVPGMHFFHCSFKAQWREKMKQSRMITKKIGRLCSVLGCKEPHNARGLCNHHGYLQRKKNGTIKQNGMNRQSNIPTL